MMGFMDKLGEGAMADNLLRALLYSLIKWIT